ncbi:hypothetical protein DFJ73DRAFT_965952 [Zopfochytrium polystomum]|nr:hypothetical protein DFJ73DRAFT_965952 [Zopfochytrium polystomum]
MALPSANAAAATASRRHSRRRRPRRFPAAVAAIHLLLLLTALPALIRPRIANTPPFALAAGPSSQASKTGTRENVDGVSVEIGEKVSNQGVDAIVYHAKHGSKDVIYKEPLPHKKLWPNEVDATRAAGQLVAAEGNKMVQNKVGTTGLKDWLQTQKNSPEAKSKYLLTDEKPEDHRGKIKLSDAIYGQVAQHQKDVGFVHHDTNSGNIRVHASPSDQPVKFAGWDGPQNGTHRLGSCSALTAVRCSVAHPAKAGAEGVAAAPAGAKDGCRGTSNQPARKTVRRQVEAVELEEARVEARPSLGTESGPRRARRQPASAAAPVGPTRPASKMAVKTQGGNVGGGAKDGGKAPPTSRRSYEFWCSLKQRTASTAAAAIEASTCNGIATAVAIVIDVGDVFPVLVVTVVVVVVVLLESSQGLSATVYHAKHGSNDVTYKELLPKPRFSETEIGATNEDFFTSLTVSSAFKPAEGDKMVQKKVDTTGLKDWLLTQKDSPEAKSKYLLSGDKPEDHPNKVKLSDAIYGQIAQHQKDVVNVHHDTKYGNIRVHASPSDKPVKFVYWRYHDLLNVRDPCSAKWFQFSADGALFRRAGKSTCNTATSRSKAGAVKTTKLAAQYEPPTTNEVAEDE